MRGELAVNGFDARVQVFGAGELGIGLANVSGVTELHDRFQCAVTLVLHAHLFGEQAHDIGGARGDCACTGGSAAGASGSGDHVRSIPMRASDAQESERELRPALRAPEGDAVASTGRMPKPSHRWA